MMYVKLFEQYISEKVDMERVEFFADRLLSPIDVEFTKHFIEQLTRPEHAAKEITDEELIDFFKRLSSNQKSLERFVKHWDHFVITDKRTAINIPFMSRVNQIVAKTIMRKRDFKSSEKRYNL